jgi:hypothetical protein
VQALQDYKPTNYDRKAIIRAAEKYSVGNFRKNLLRAIEKFLNT